MQQEVKNQLSKYFENEISKINGGIRKNTRELSWLSDKQRALKKCRHELSKILNKIKGY